MDNILIVARQVAMLFVLMGLGALLRRIRLLTDAGVAGLVNLLIFIVTPALIIDVFQRPFDKSMLWGLGTAFVVAVLAHLVFIALSYALIRNKTENTRKSLLLSVVFSNAGFMGIPLEEALFGEIGVFFGIVYVVVFNLMIWSWGLKTMQRGCGATTNSKMIVNPGTVGLMIGAPLFFFSVHLPDVISTPIQHLSSINTPLAMIIVGYSLAGSRLAKVARMPTLYFAAFVRLIGYPLLFVGVLYFFRNILNRDMILALTVSSSAPVAAMVPMFATKFKRDEETAVALVSGTTLLSIITMPLVIALAMSIL